MVESERVARKGLAPREHHPPHPINAVGLGPDRADPILVRAAPYLPSCWLPSTAKLSPSVSEGVKMLK